METQRTELTSVELPILIVRFKNASNSVLSLSFPNEPDEVIISAVNGLEKKELLKIQRLIGGGIRNIIDLLPGEVEERYYLLRDEGIFDLANGEIEIKATIGIDYLYEDSISEQVSTNIVYKSPNKIELTQYLQNIKYESNATLRNLKILSVTDDIVIPYIIEYPLKDGWLAECSKTLMSISSDKADEVILKIWENAENNKITRQRISENIYKRKSKYRKIIVLEAMRSEDGYIIRNSLRYFVNWGKKDDVSDLEKINIMEGYKSELENIINDLKDR